ncbi:hypothetical protein OAI76_03785 [Alphaproteobacteria bacterium]|nr:hypothetical protein [Alphaproteobacteria bacterium]
MHSPISGCSRRKSLRPGMPISHRVVKFNLSDGAMRHLVIRSWSRLSLSSSASKRTCLSDGGFLPNRGLEVVTARAI